MKMNREMTLDHPLHGKRAIVVSRRIDRDDILVRLNDGSYATVHLLWDVSSPETRSATYPRWLQYRSLEVFILTMQKHAKEYGDTT